MKKIIRRWLLNILGQPKQIIHSNKSCAIIYDNGFLMLTMPDGTPIPLQTGLKIEDKFPETKTCNVTITVKVIISE